MQLTSLRPRRRRAARETARVDQEAGGNRFATLSAVAQRIAGLIDGPVSEALVVILTELYGDALARILDAIVEAPAGETILDRLCDDRLVGGLLVVHDLHPRPLAARVERALAAVAQTSMHSAVPPVLDRIEDDVVYVRLCASTGPATRTAIARAIAEAAPEISRVSADLQFEEERLLQL